MVKIRTRDDHLFGPGPKRILSLDGGGVRGLVSLGILKRIEDLLRARAPVEHREAFRLSDYFDLIGGTSTGAIIASLLALGYDVTSIIRLYSDMAPKVFGRTQWFQGVKSKFDSAALDAAVKDTLSDFLKRSGRNPTDIGVLRLGTDLLRTGLGLIAKRIDRGSVWALTNNPKSKYWDPKSPLWDEHFAALGRPRDFYPNSDYSLATIIRASASAPFYLEGVNLDISPVEEGHFLDGGASPFNNPSQELFLMTTLKAFGPGWTNETVSPFGYAWETGADKLFLLSVGTGTWRLRLDSREFQRMWTISQAKEALLSVIDDASLSATTWLQALSESPKATTINGNLEQMHHLRIVPDPLLTFRRISPRLEQDWLAGLGDKFKLTPGQIDKTRELDHSAATNLDRLLAIGLATGERDISDADLPAAFDLHY